MTAWIHPRRWLGLGVATSLLCALSTFLPWVQSGRVTRSGMETARSAKRLGLLDGGFGPAIAAAWFLVPLMAAVAFTTWVLRRNRISALASFYCGAVLLAAGFGVSQGPLPRQSGVTLGIWSGALTVALVLVATGFAIVQRRQNAPQSGGSGQFVGSGEEI